MKVMAAIWLLAFCGLFLTGCAVVQPRARESASKWALQNTPLNWSAAALDNATAEHIAWAKAYRGRIGEVAGPRTIENTLVPYNDMMMHLDAAVSQCQLLFQVHPDQSVREAAEQGEREVTEYATALSLDRELYDALKAMDVFPADSGTQYLVEKKLRDFRRAGVDKSDEVRKRIAVLRDEIVKIGQEFAKNIREDENTRHILLNSPSDLEGLPNDWKARHAPGPDGKIKVTTRTPDYAPFMTYARSGEARLKLYKESRNRGYPKNMEVLESLLAKRHELAQLLGYAHWADYITEDKMIGSAANARSFIDQIAKISRTPADRDYQVLLARKRKDATGAAKVEDWEKGYYDELIKKEQYQLNAEELRQYLNFDDVQQGLFDLTSKMFGVTYRQVEGLTLWHASVTAWDIYEGEKPIGRFYLDLHPRDNKYGHAAQFDYRTGIAGARLPQAALVCNFPNPAESEGRVALMEHNDVVTFFHEFGHLLHFIFAGHQKWIGNSGISTEWDFVEAPSQMLEEWVFNPQTLQSFAKHYQTREPIPAALVEKLRRAADFGKGLNAAHQMFYASVSLNYYDKDPKNLDTTSLLMDLQEKYSSFDYVPDTHFQCGFGHLDGYSATYYTYMWSKVIAKDMFSRFEEDGLLNRKTSRRYRQAVLDPGGSKKAADLVRDFLGRPYSPDAFETWLNRM